MKGNMFLGYARGSVGDVTFSRAKGQQRARARNREPNNPRTVSQMRQRALFADSVKFFSHGLKGLFKFAFEDKKSNMSDYNSFMSHNITNGVRISKQASMSPFYPAIGHWQVSCGTLSPVIVTLAEAANNWRLQSTSQSESFTTWGQVSDALKRDYRLMEGDIMTTVYIIAKGVTASNCPALDAPEEYNGTEWMLKQYKIDSTSTDSIPQEFGIGQGFINIDKGAVETNQFAQAFAVIFSRKTDRGIKVSSSDLVNNAVAETIYNASIAPEWEEKVLQSWYVEEDAILEGSLIP